MRAAWWAAALLIPTVLSGQVVVVTGDELGTESAIARQAVRQFNDRATTSVFGSFEISSDEEFVGDVAVANGTLTIEGEVRGDVVAINADVVLRPGSRVRGDILILGGSLTRAESARLEGNTRLHRARVATHRAGDRLVLEPVDRRRSRRPRAPTRRGRWPHGGLDIVLTTGGTYNRVEGLPIMAGPRISWRGHDGNEFLIEALAIGRTAGDFENNRQDIGYVARAALTLGNGSGVTLGGRVYDAVEPIEDWQLPADEVGAATFLWHRDYRDYYLNRGVEGFIEIAPDRDLTLRGSIARNEESSVRARDPWTPFRKNEPWRANPTIDAGTFTSIRAGIQYDSRYDGRSWRSAWYLAAEFEQGSSDDVRPLLLPPSIRGPIPTTETYTFQRLFVDIRRYERLGGGQVRLRALAGGTLGKDPLPVQRRVSLGGPDPLPGFRFRQFTCGGGLFLMSRPALCDRVALAQLEYRGDLSVSTHRSSSRARRRHRSNDDWDFDDWFWIDGPEFVLFADAGTAWIDADGPGDIEADVGVGLEFGGLGVYAAKAVTDGASAHLTIRLNRRF